MRHSVNPRTQTLGDFHPTLCYSLDYCMGSFPCGSILPIASVPKSKYKVERASWPKNTDAVSS